MAAALAPYTLAGKLEREETTRPLARLAETKETAKSQIADCRWKIAQHQTRFHHGLEVRLHPNERFNSGISNQTSTPHVGIYGCEHDCADSLSPR